MSMDDITTYMAKREKSTLTAPNPEGSPTGAELGLTLNHHNSIPVGGLLNPPTGSTLPSAIGGSSSAGGTSTATVMVARGGRESPNTTTTPSAATTSLPATPQHAYFQKLATPQGSLSHLPPNLINLGGGGGGSGSGGAANNMSTSSPPGTIASTVAGGGVANSSLAGNPLSAAAAAASGLFADVVVPSSASVNATVAAMANSVRNSPSHHPASQQHIRHLSDIARMVVRNQHAAHCDPTSVANNPTLAVDHANTTALALAQRREFSFETGDTGLINFLCSVPHLYMISNSDIREISRQLLRREFNLHDTILVNKQRVAHVYIVLKGRVEAYNVSQLQWDPKSLRPEDMVTHHERIGTVEVANMFCIDSVVFSEPSEFLYCAGEDKTLLGLIPANIFLSILNRNIAMRQSIGRKLADHMDIFICFKDFCRHIFSHETAKHEYLPLWQILHAYERLENCIHTKRASQEIDVDAWNYAIKRLPENLTSTFVFDLVRSLPPFLTTQMKELAKVPASTSSTGIGEVRYIVTKERRRCSWQLGMEGKTLVLLRDGFTDLLDFITCLCIHIIESNKLRGRLQGMVSPPAVDIMEAKLKDISKRQQLMTCGLGGGGGGGGGGGATASATVSPTGAGTATLPSIAVTAPASGSASSGGNMNSNGNNPAILAAMTSTHNNTPAITTAATAAANNPNTSSGGVAGATTNGGVEARDIREVLAKMPLSERERFGLHRNWGDSCLRNIYSVMMHREEYLLRVDVSASRQFMTDPFHEWSLNLRKKLMLVMKLNPQGHLPSDLIIDIISSNTHSTKSLLSPYPRLHRAKILAHAKEKKPDLYNLPWAVEEDLVYANCRNYMDATGTGKEFNECLKKCGFEILEDTAMTGLQVDIVPVSQINFNEVDPLLSARNCRAAGPRHFILNMDFAFGAQADGITATLVDTFGKHIRSFNVMGKAGGIASSMRRGDIQLASHVLLSKSSLTTEDYLDELRSCGNLDLTTDFVQSICGQHSKIQVFNGPVLTIPGTMLQNDKLLLYYRHIWHCVGVEMEGSYFLRQLKENIKAGLLKDGIVTRFGYYTSDMPLHSLQGDASLSTPMKPNEGTPPLYAVARALLIRICGGTDQLSKEGMEELCGPSEAIRNQIQHQLLKEQYKLQQQQQQFGGGGGGGANNCNNINTSSSGYFCGIGGVPGNIMFPFRGSIGSPGGGAAGAAGSASGGGSGLSAAMLRNFNNAINNFANNNNNGGSSASNNVNNGLGGGVGGVGGADESSDDQQPMLMRDMSIHLTKNPMMLHHGHHDNHFGGGGCGCPNNNNTNNTTTTAGAPPTLHNATRANSIVGGGNSTTTAITNNNSGAAAAAFAKLPSSAAAAAAGKSTNHQSNNNNTFLHNSSTLNETFSPTLKHPNPNTATATYTTTATSVSACGCDKINKSVNNNNNGSEQQSTTTFCFETVDGVTGVETRMCVETIDVSPKGGGEGGNINAINGRRDSSTSVEIGADNYVESGEDDGETQLDEWSPKTKKKDNNNTNNSGNGTKARRVYTSDEVAAAAAQATAAVCDADDDAALAAAGGVGGAFTATPPPPPRTSVSSDTASDTVPPSLHNISTAHNSVSTSASGHGGGGTTTPPPSTYGAATTATGSNAHGNNSNHSHIGINSDSTIHGGSGGSAVRDATTQPGSASSTAGAAAASSPVAAEEEEGDDLEEEEEEEAAAAAVLRGCNNSGNNAAAAGKAQRRGSTGASTKKDGSLTTTPKRKKKRSTSLSASSSSAAVVTSSGSAAPHYNIGKGGAHDVPTAKKK